MLPFDDTIADVSVGTGGETARVNKLVEGRLIDL